MANDVFMSNVQPKSAKAAPPETTQDFRRPPTEENLAQQQTEVTAVPAKPVTPPSNREDLLLRKMEDFVRTGEASPRQIELLNRARQLKGLEPVLPGEQRQRPSAAPQNEDPLMRPVGLAATGFNKGLAAYVDLMNDGLKAIGLPVSDEPFMGSAFVDKYLAGSQFQPANMFESMLQRAGFEVGANAPILAGAEVIRGASSATNAAVTMNKQTLDAAAAGRDPGSVFQAVRSLPSVIVEQLQAVGPAKLAALESALAAGAGAGADAVSKIFPEGGRLAEFVGEFVGSFTPSVVMGMIRKTLQGAKTVGRVALGVESEQETKKRLGDTLRPAAQPEDVQAGVQRAGELREEVSPGAKPGEGLNLSAGEAITKGSVSDTQLAFEKSSPAARAKAREQREQNVQAVFDYFHKTEPQGNTTALVERLEAERTALLESGASNVARTQARIDAVRGDLSKRGALLLDDMERRMYAADQVVDARLRALGPQLRRKERGEVIRGAYLEEVGKFRERSAADYRELDMLGHAELPVGSTIQKMADLEAQFPEQLQVIRKMSPRVAQVLDRLGHDYELTQRAEKALADLEIRDASGKGFRTVDDMGRPSGGMSRGTPQWYQDLSIKVEKVLSQQALDGAVRKSSSRDTIINALNALRDGKAPGNEGLLKEVADTIRRDREFLKSPYYEPVMDELNGAPSASLKDLKQVRSDLLALSRSARASDNRVQNYVLHEVIEAVDADIDQLLPGASSYAGLYPDHGTLYRNISAEYRAGVETLYKGTVNKLRQVNRYGDYKQDDESIPGLFWKNESTINDFLKAFPNRGMAQIALRDFALDHFAEFAIKRMPDGRLTVDSSAANEWLRQNQDKLKAFPDLAQHFRNAVNLQSDADGLREQVKRYLDGKRGEEALMRRVEAERRPWDFTQRDLAEAEQELKHAADIATRSQHDWEASKASLFLKEPAGSVGYRIATSKDPVGDYDKVLKLVQKDQEAVAGLNKAIWEGLTEKIQPRLTGLTGDANLGVFHKELQNWIEGNADLMQRVLGPDGFKRIQTTAEVVQKIARGGRDRSDTAINLRIQAALASTWISRAWATISGRVPMGFGAAERGAQFLINTFARMTARQQEAILLESFFNPKVYQTLVNAGTYGPDNALVKKQLHLHLLNLGVADEGQE